MNRVAVATVLTGVVLLAASACHDKSTEPTGTVVSGGNAAPCDPPPGQSYCVSARTLTIRDRAGHTRLLEVPEAVYQQCGYGFAYPACARPSP